MAAALANAPLYDDNRLALIVTSPWQLVMLLKLVSRKLSRTNSIDGLDEPSKGIFAGYVSNVPSFVALFPGGNSTRLNIGKDLCNRLSLYTIPL